MDKKFCDLCGEETGLKDVRAVAVTDLEGKPKIKTKEICVFCKEKLLNLLNHWGDACVSSTGQDKKSSAS